MPLEELGKSYYRHLSDTREALSSAFSKISSEDKNAEIRKIVDEASALALDLGTQRCRWQLFLPGRKDIVSTKGFDPYEDLNKANTPMDYGEVQLAVKHGLRKTGDGRGGSFGTIANVRSAGVYVTARR